MRHNRAPRLIRAARWARLVVHLAEAAYILGVRWPRASASRREALAAGWSLGLLRLLAIRVEVEGETPQGARRKPALLVANHVSWLDIFAIGAVRHTRFIAKHEIRDWPLAGWIANRAGTLFVRRGSRKDAARTTEAMREALSSGDWVGFFPEGTTTEGDQLLRFHSALFEPAIGHGAPVRPVAVRYEHPDGTLLREAAFVGDMSFAESLGRVIGVRSTVVRIVFAPPIEAAQGDRRSIASEAERRIASALGVTPTSRAPETPAGPPGAAP
jgi:1-acyl-sn-glycerol-3-phosphate acyltransferase